MRVHFPVNQICLDHADEPSIAAVYADSHAYKDRFLADILNQFQEASRRHLKCGPSRVSEL